MNRRDLISKLSLVPVVGGFAGRMLPFTRSFASSRFLDERDLFRELGVRTFINATGTITAMSGSLMHDYVLNTIRNASKDFCMLDELQDKVGERIAKLTHAEAATVTSGAFSALTLGMAGILTGLDPHKADQLPHLENTGMKSEVIIQQTHQIHYNHALVNCGVRLVYVETADDIERVVSERTASMHYLGSAALRGKISPEEWVSIGQKHNLPCSIDIAANIPPVTNIWKFNEMGFSFVALSGGKALRGPQSAGILMGKKDLIAAARLSACPRGSTVGRGMKVNKEEIVGMLVALEHYLGQDHDKEWREWQRRIDYIAKVARSVDGVSALSFVPPIADHTPTLKISWEKNKINTTGRDLLSALRDGNPSIEAYGPEDNGITVTSWMLKEGQEKIVARRIREELQKSKV